MRKRCQIYKVDAPLKDHVESFCAAQNQIRNELAV